jgi:hypothetical protein
MGRRPVLDGIDVEVVEVEVEDRIEDEYEDETEDDCEAEDELMESDDDSEDDAEEEANEEVDDEEFVERDAEEEEADAEADRVWVLDAFCEDVMTEPDEDSDVAETDVEDPWDEEPELIEEADDDDEA